MKKNYKIMYVLLIVFCVFAITCESNATGFWTTAKDWIEVGIDGKKDTAFTTTTTMENVAKTTFQEVIDFIWSLGLLTIFICTIILGIKYMFVPPGEKSRIKQATTPYIIGVVIIFGAVTIWKFIIDLLNGSL